MKKNNPTNRGFTLIEIIVSLAVFIVVAVIAVGAFLKILDANKQSQSLETAMTNANFAIDSMVRDLRVGEDYYCYNSASGNYPPSSGPVKSTCPNSPFISAPGGAVYPTIAFYSSQSPSGWTCATPPIHAYRYNPSTKVIEKAEQSLSACQGNDNDVGDSASPFVPLTASNFDIQSFGISVDVTAQPKVFLYMQASAGSNAQNQTVFTLQTTASERIMNGQ